MLYLSNALQSAFAPLPYEIQVSQADLWSALFEKKASISVTSAIISLQY